MRYRIYKVVNAKGYYLSARQLSISKQAIAHDLETNKHKGRNPRSKPDIVGALD
jgi:hypothetical protein